MWHRNYFFGNWHYIKTINYHIWRFYLPKYDLWKFGLELRCDNMTLCSFAKRVKIKLKNQNNYVQEQLEWKLTSCYHSSFNGIERSCCFDFFLICLSFCCLIRMNKRFGSGLYIFPEIFANFTGIVTRSLPRWD